MDPITDETVYWGVPEYDDNLTRWSYFIRTDFSDYDYRSHMIWWKIDDEEYGVRDLGESVLTSDTLAGIKAIIDSELD